MPDDAVAAQAAHQFCVCQAQLEPVINPTALAALIPTTTALLAWVQMQTPAAAAGCGCTIVYSCSRLLLKT